MERNESNTQHHKPTEIQTESEEMIIKIQTIDNIYQLTIKRNATVSDLKDKILELLNVPIIKQRLLFQGKWLQNSNEKLKNYKITDENVVHLVAKTNEEPEQNPQPNLNQVNQSIDEFNGLIEIPVIRSNRRARRRRVPHFDISESFESLHQNISTINLIQQCKNKYDENQVLTSRVITPFDFSKSKYEVGQWVDVKDTIDQWLEAQIMQVRNNQVYVHYNGWGTRWDEWIDNSSPRIAAFKTYTLQSTSSVFLSPYPSFLPDANIEPQQRSIDSFYYMEKSVNSMNEIAKIIETMGKLRKRNTIRTSEFRENQEERTKMRSEEEESKQDSNINRNQTQGLSNSDHELLFLCTQLIPLMDRTGRLLSDISLHLSHLVLNNNLFPQIFLGYNQNNEISDTLSCTSNYSMYTNEGSAMSGFNNFEFLNNLQNRQNQVNNVSNTNIAQNIQNSNQLINNYIQTNRGNQTQNFENPNVRNERSTLQNQNNDFNVQNNRINNTVLNLNPETFPKINLQIPAMLSPGEIALVNGYNPYGEPNIDIYVHTLVATSNLPRNNSQTSQQGNINQVNNEITLNVNPTNSENQSTRNEISIQTETLRSSELTRAILNGNQNINYSLQERNNNQSIFTQNSNVQQNPQTSNNFNNLENIISSIQRPNHDRRNSLGSDISRNSNQNLSFNQNINRPVNIINNRNLVTNTVSNNVNTINTNHHRNSHTSAKISSNQLNENLKETSTQTEGMNQAQIKFNLNENLDTMSNKSEKNNNDIRRFYGKSQKSVKSVLSDISDLDHYNEEESSSDFRAKNNINFKFNNRNNNPNDSRNLSINTLSKLNESFHSASASLVSKNENEYEDKDEDKNMDR